LTPFIATSLDAQAVKTFHAIPSRDKIPCFSTLCKEFDGWQLMAAARRDRGGATQARPVACGFENGKLKFAILRA